MTSWHKIFLGASTFGTCFVTTRLSTEENGYNEEEWKMIEETLKIFEDDKPNIAVTCVRVPVLRAHCESINLQFQKKVESLDDVYSVLPLHQA